MNTTNVLSLEEKTFLAQFLGYKFSDTENAWIKDKFIEGSDLIGERRVLCRSMNDSGWNSSKWILEIVSTICSDLRVFEFTLANGGIRRVGIRMTYSEHLSSSELPNYLGTREEMETIMLDNLVVDSNDNMILKTVINPEVYTNSEGIENYKCHYRPLKSYYQTSIYFVPLEYVRVSVSEGGELHRKAIEVKEADEAHNGKVMIGLNKLEYRNAKSWTNYAEPLGSNMIDRMFNLAKGLQALLYQACWDKYDFRFTELKLLE